MAQYVVGGTVAIDSAAYQRRSFEQAAFDSLSANRWVLLLGPRQHGKSSALVRLSAQLADEGFTVAFLDLQVLAGRTNTDYVGWLRRLFTAIAGRLGRGLVSPDSKRDDDVAAWFESAFDGVEGSIVLLIDEAAAVPAEHRTRFFAQLRVLYNKRATSRPEDLGNRLLLLFCGTFRPEKMIDDENSPFNVCAVLHSDDLTEGQAQALAADVSGADLVPLASEAYAAVGGQPYLLQALLDAASAGAGVEDQRVLLKAKLQSVRRGEDGHVGYLLRRVAAEDGAATLVGEIASEPSGIPFSVSDLHSFLRIVGIAGVVAMDGRERLVARNLLYRETAAASPQFAKIQPTTAPNVMVAEPPSAFDVVTGPILRQLAADSYAGGVNAYMAGDLRLALVAFGSTYEALMFDFLEHLDQPSRDMACQAVSTSKGASVTGRPKDWDFATMIAVAQATGKFKYARADMNTAVRQWRNLVHPENALRNYQPQEDLRAEVTIVVFTITKVLQALR